MEKYYNIELSKIESGILKEFLIKNNIKFEISNSDNMVHFEILLNKENYNKVNKFLK